MEEDTTHFEFTVSSALHAGSASSPPLTAELTYTEVIRRKIHLQTTTLSLPEQTFLHQNNNNFIPLYTPNNTVFITHLGTTVTYSLNSAGISQIMTHLGVHSSSTIFHEIYRAITSTISRGREVTQVKIKKITTKVYQLDQDSKNLLIGYDSLPFLEYNANNNTNESKECAICLEDYEEASIVAKLSCGHYFHGACINEWWQVQQHCPFCRIHTSNSSPFTFFFWIFV